MMVVLVLAGLVVAVVFATVVVGINNYCLERYNHKPFSVLSTFWVGVASFAMLFAVLALPVGFVVHQEPMTSSEIDQASSDLEAELANAQQAAKTLKDPVDKAEAENRVRELSKATAPKTKDVYTWGNFTQFLQWPIPGSLKNSLYCATTTLVVFLGIFVTTGLKTSWPVAVVTIVVQIAISVAVVAFLLLLYFVTAYKRNKSGSVGGY